jgi:hypothetical protein
MNLTPPAVVFPRLRKGIHSLLPQLKGNTPSAAQLSSLLTRSQAQAVPDGPTDRKWIKYRHVETGGAWRVDVVIAAPIDPDDEERAALQDEQ